MAARVKKKSKLVTIYIAIIGDGYVYGGSLDPSAAHATGNQYWIGLRLEHDPFEIVEATVPPDIAEKLVLQGTSDQEYSDGYDAMRDARASAGSWKVIDRYEGSGSSNDDDDDEADEEEDEGGDDEGGEPDEPSEEDWVTNDGDRENRGGREVFREVGTSKVMCVVEDGEDTWAKLEEAMKRENFFPNVWRISDHGNAHLLKKED